MGLDQFLYRSAADRPIKDDEETWVQTYAAFKAKHGQMVYGNDDAPNSYAAFKRELAVVSNCEEVAYWRKFNALHLWMERALNNDEQTNGEMLPISLEQLAGLKVTCERVAADPTLGPTFLPTGGRFFFGSTDYDEWYVGDCIETANELDRILREEEAWCRAGNRPHVFHYCSSW